MLFTIICTQRRERNKNWTERSEKSDEGKKNTQTLRKRRTGTTNEVETYTTHLLVWNFHRTRLPLIILSLTGPSLTDRNHDTQNSRVREDDCLYQSHARRNGVQKLPHAVVTVQFQSGVLHISIAHEAKTCLHSDVFDLKQAT